MEREFVNPQNLEKHGFKNTGFVYWNLATPLLYEEATRRFGAILENVAFESMTGRLNLDDDFLTENTRAASSATSPTPPEGGWEGAPKTSSW